jgi:rhodanese-related sulfurtransferase
LNHDEFSAEVKKLATENNKPVVFYCNGKTCAKSYKGARQAARAGVKNLYAFDAGVFDWAKAKPELTVLLGTSPIKPGDLISKADLDARMLSPKEFEKRVQQGGNISVVDVRDRIQRDILLFPLKEKRITLNQEQELTAFLKKEAAAGKTLYIYDKVGKQVSWLQYRLNALGIRNYYFLKGGSEAMYKAL